MKYCTKCGAEIEDGIKFCRKCGAPIYHEKDVEKDDNNIKIKDDTAEIEKKSTEGITKQEKSHDKEAEEVKLEQDKVSETAVSNGTISTDNKDSKKNKKTKAVVISIIGTVVVICAVLGAIFFKQISGTYYTMKCDDSLLENEKIDYAVKAVEAYGSDNHKKMLKDVLMNASDDELDLADKKLDEVSAKLSEEELKNISEAIKEKKIDNYCSKKQYDKALEQFEKLNDIGVDFKADKHYDEVMIATACNLTNTSVKANKDMLMEENSVCYDNLDDDVFDEIIEVKNGNQFSSSNDMKINLYKLQNGIYKIVDTKTISGGYNKKITGIYNYAENTKGIYLNYTDKKSPNTKATSVYGVNNEKLSLKGTVCGDDYTEPDDFDNDGIYEVLACNKDYSSQPSLQNKKWYKINDDGTDPTEVSSKNDAGNINITISNGNNFVIDNGTSSVVSMKDVNYVFADSNKRYLSDNDLRNLNKDTLAIARNEIFARHGYIFKEEPYKSWFENKSWYRKNPSYDGSDACFNKYELDNYKLIQEYEKK